VAVQTVEPGTEIVAAAQFNDDRLGPAAGAPPARSFHQFAGSVTWYTSGLPLALLQFAPHQIRVPA
jgi:hypothetical protein